MAFFFSRTEFVGDRTWPCGDGHRQSPAPDERHGRGGRGEGICQAMSIGSAARKTAEGAPTGHQLLESFPAAWSPASESRSLTQAKLVLP